jgi:hypothetical protein
MYFYGASQWASLHFFSALITQPKMEAKGKKATIMISEKSILATLGLQCSCHTLCSDHWTKQALYQAQRSYFSLTRLEQLQKVYDILWNSECPYPGNYFNSGRYDL